MLIFAAWSSLPVNKWDFFKQFCHSFLLQFWRVHEVFTGRGERRAIVEKEPEEHQEQENQENQKTPVLRSELKPWKKEGRKGKENINTE